MIQNAAARVGTSTREFDHITPILASLQTQTYADDTQNCTKHIMICVIIPWAPLVHCFLQSP